MQNYIIEGLDRLGKSTLIEGIQNAKGYHTVIHYSKPKLLDFYKSEAGGNLTQKKLQLLAYQCHSFTAMFNMLSGNSGPFIMDRAHLGEMVYAPLYRGYSGDYVFELESYSLDAESEFGDEWEWNLKNTRLILLTEDFSKSKHFADDGESLGPESARAKEQEMFIAAFERSRLTNKKIICVTAEDGGFRSKEDILAEALS